ncbi:hypothetical protein [Neobacillus sp. D3-1R]|uniref:hypothetical protein n=1 Tax=Neobacillus sp. D3-1R TaxID=3445778 RepID=UPI003FA00761
MSTIVSSIISSVFKQDSKQQLQPTSLRPGQIFNGKILKLFPNQTAEVQIGNQKMIAQLDIALQAGSRYWLQVQPGEGKIYLKVLNNISGVSSNQDSLEAVLRAFGLTGSKENLDIIPFFLKEQLPVSKEILQQTANWIKNMDHPEQGLNTIKWMMQQGYPMKKEIFQSLVSMQSQTPLTELMRKFYDQVNLEGDKSTVSNSLKQILTSFITNESKQVGEKILRTIITKWVNEEDDGVPFSIIKKLGFFPMHTDENTILRETMKNSNFPDKIPTIRQNVISSQVELNEQVKQILQSLKLQDQVVMMLPSKLIELMKQSISVNEKHFLETIISTEILPSSREIDDQFHPIFKKMIHSIGFQYEKDIFDHFKGLENDPVKQESLKSLLIQYVKDESNFSEKQTGEQLLQRINGMQLLSKEMGPLMQVVMQIPIPLWTSVPELTLQWSGRKTEEGKIDPNFCRILFYLELENLKETMVDLKIQNRVVSIKIINDQHQWLQNLKPLHDLLKENLKGMDYHLSSLQFVKANNDQMGKERKGEFPTIYENQSYSGVDIKV